MSRNRNQINIKKTSSFKKYINNKIVDDEAMDLIYNGDNLVVNFYKNDNEYNLNFNRNEINNFIQSIFGQPASPEPILQRLENDFGISLTPDEKHFKINMGNAKSLLEESPIEIESQSQNPYQSNYDSEAIPIEGIDQSQLSTKEEAAIESASNALSEILREYNEEEPELYSDRSHGRRSHSDRSHGRRSHSDRSHGRRSHSDRSHPRHSHSYPKKSHPKSKHLYVHTSNRAHPKKARRQKTCKNILRKLAIPHTSPTKKRKTSLRRYDYHELPLMDDSFLTNLEL